MFNVLINFGVIWLMWVVWMVIVLSWCKLVRIGVVCLVNLGFLVVGNVVIVRL